MKKAEQQTLARLRQMILDGELPGGERLSEVVVAGMLGVSRTPAKFALTRLEMTGLIKKLPGRGYEVCKVSLGDLEMVIKLRGILEGAAAAALASNGVQEGTRMNLTRSIEMTEPIVLRRQISMEDVAVFQDANTLFHETIMRDCGNEYIALSYEPIRHLPMAALGTYAPNPDLLDKELLRMSVGHAQHVIIAKAVEEGDAGRAETVMREHSNATFEYARLFVGQRVAEHIPTLLQAV